MKSLFIIACLSGLLAQGLAAKPAPAELLLEGRRSAETGYVTKADGNTIYFSASPSGRNEVPYPKDRIARITFKPPEGWREAQQKRLSGNYVEAANLYDGIAADYRNVETLEDNYGSLARLYQLESLRNLGEYRQLAAKRSQLKKIGLSEKYHPQVDLFVGWGMLAELDTPARIAQLERLVDSYREVKLVPDLLAQVFYLGGVANEKSEKPEQALTDYHRVFTLDFGSDRGLAKMAMEAALELYAADEEIDDDDNRARLEEAHGLARVYKSVFGNLPSQVSRFDGPVPPPADEDAS